VAVTYYDFRNNTPAPGLSTDVWMVHAHPADGLTNPASWTSENRMSPVSFDMESAPVRAGYFLRDYPRLVAEGKNFGAFFSMPTAADSGSIFFRDPLPAEARAETDETDSPSAGQSLPASGALSGPNGFLTLQSATVDLLNAGNKRGERPAQH